MDELKTVTGLAQLGSFGLLCAIVYWVMRNIPKHFELLAQERTNHQQAMILQAGEHRKIVEGLTIQYVEQVKYEREDCYKRHEEMRETHLEQFAEVINRLDKTHETIREVRHQVANIAQVKSNEKAIAEEKSKENTRGHKNA